jgi:hypothetical protein
MNISLTLKHALEHVRQEQLIARIVRESEATADIKSSTGATAAGDERRLRGLPAIGRGVAGAIPGTSPHADR